MSDWLLEQPAAKPQIQGTSVAYDNADEVDSITFRINASSGWFSLAARKTSCAHDINEICHDKSGIGGRSRGCPHAALPTSI